MAREAFEDLESPFLDEELFAIEPSLEVEQGEEDSFAGETEYHEAVADEETVDETAHEGDYEALHETDEEADAGAEEWEEAFNAEEYAIEPEADEHEAGVEPAAQDEGAVSEHAEAIEHDSEAGASEDEGFDLRGTTLESTVEEIESEDPPAKSGTVGTTGLLTVSIILDQPAESDDKFQLVSSDRAYSKTLGAADATPLVAGATLLRFSGVNSKKQYTLVHVRSKGSSYKLIPNTPFAHLTSAGHRQKSAAHTYVTLPSQLPRMLPDPYGKDNPVDPLLVAASPALNDLAVEDPVV